MSEEENIEESSKLQASSDKPLGKLEVKEESASETRQPETLSDPAISRADSDQQPAGNELSAGKQATENMETHADHLHNAPSHGVKHYLFEFFMLFLAVFCGFLAENQREHMVEHRREKEFMRSMVDDLYRDTAAISRGIRLLDYRLKKLDSAILIYANHKKHTPAQVAEIGRLSESGLINVTVVFADRTSSQLKNSGAMRLIRKKTVADSLTKYWNGIEVSNNSWERAQVNRFESRRIGYRIFGFFHEFYIRRYIDSSFTVESSLLLDHSPLLLGEYINNVYKFADGYRAEFYPQLKQQLKLAEDLIGLIKKEYHLK